MRQPVADEVAQGIVIGVADAAHGWLNDCFSQTLGVANGNVFPATVAKMNNPALTGWAASLKRLLKCIKNQVDVGRSRCFPAHDAVGACVDHVGEINKPLPC